MSSKAGRKAKDIVVQPVIDPALDQAKLEGAMVAMRDQAQEGQAELADLAMGIGALQAFDLMGKFAAASQVATFKRIRESKQINRLAIRKPDGGVAICDSMREACPLLFGRSYDTMLREEESYNLLGEQAYEIASRLGLNRSALRAARALPPEKLEIVRTAIGNGNTKAEVLSVIEDLAEKVQQAEAETAEAKAELKASEEVAAAKSKTIDKLQRDLKRIEKLPPDQQLANLKKEATAMADDAEGAILGSLRQALVTVSNHGEERGLHDVFLAGLVGQVQAQLNALRKEFNLPDVSTAQEQKLLAEMEQWDK